MELEVIDHLILQTDCLIIQSPNCKVVKILELF